MPDEFEPKNNSLIYKDADGQRKNALVVIVVNQDGEPVDALRVKARHVKIKNGVTQGGTETIMEADPGRTGLVLRNDSDTKMYFNTIEDADDGEGYPLDAGRGYAFEAFGLLPSDAISIWCASPDKRWAAMYASNSENMEDSNA
jgi:hypothetical protein